MIGIVLAGGLNTRYPDLKGLIEVGGRTLIERNIEVLGSVVDEVFISANEPEHYFRFGLPIIGDVVESGGPLSGIYSVLRHTEADRAVVVACDMPFVNTELIKHISGIIEGDAVVPVFESRPQPLPAVYASSALRVMRRRLLGGDRSLLGLMDEIGVTFVEEDVVRRIDPEGGSFVNINTADDLKEALKNA